MKIDQITQAAQAAMNALVGAKIYPVNTIDDTKPESYALTYGNPQLFADIATTIETNSQAADLVYNALADVLVKIVIEDRAYAKDAPPLICVVVE